jgi:hypothetical protein
MLCFALSDWRLRVLRRLFLGLEPHDAIKYHPDFDLIRRFLLRMHSGRFGKGNLLFGPMMGTINHLKTLSRQVAGPIDSQSFDDLACASSLDPVPSASCGLVALSVRNACSVASALIKPWNEH